MKKIISLMAAVLLSLSLCCTALAQGTGSQPLLVDGAGLLTEEEYQAVLDTLRTAGDALNFDIVIVTTDDLQSCTPMEYADDFFDYGGYGRGTNRDGCLLLLHMDAERGYWISACGYGITAMTDYGIRCVGEDIVDDLSAGNYAEAFQSFVADVEYLVTEARAGRVFDSSGSEGTYTEPQGFGLQHLFYGLIGGLAITLIVMRILKSQLRSVAAKAAATDYYVDGSLHLTGAYDRFAGRTVRRVRQQKESSGGSSTHRGSSGASHGGGGGRF